MTVDQIITRYVYLHGEVSLNGLGTIRLLTPVPDDEFLQKHKFHAISNLEFEHTPLVATTPQFIDFYSTQRGKIRSLAENDVEAYLGIATQFLNIGNPVEIKGLGTITKQKSGALVMNPGFFIHTKDDTPSPKFREKHQRSSEEFSLREAKGQTSARLRGSVRLLLSVLGLLALAVFVWWLVRYISSTGANEKMDDAASTAVNSAVSNVPPAAIDSIGQSARTQDSLAVYKWKAVITKITSRRRADSLWDAKWSKITTPIFRDSTPEGLHRFYSVFESRIADTTSARDSIARFFARRITIERIQ